MRLTQERCWCWSLNWGWSLGLSLSLSLSIRKLVGNSPPNNYRTYNTEMLRRSTSSHVSVLRHLGGHRRKLLEFVLELEFELESGFEPLIKGKLWRSYRDISILPQNLFNDACSLGSPLAMQVLRDAEHMRYLNWSLCLCLSLSASLEGCFYFYNGDVSIPFQYIHIQIHTSGTYAIFQWSWQRCAGHLNWDMGMAGAILG